MKIVFISHLAHSQGGAQGVLVDLIKGLKQYYPEYQIYIIFPKKGDLIDICSPYINGYKIIKQPWWIIPGKKNQMPYSNRTFFPYSEICYKNFTISSKNTARFCHY